MPYSHYKNHTQPKGCKPCLLCPVSRGRTARVHLGYGEYIWLCPSHADPSFRASYDGRDFLLSVQLELESAGAMTRRRSLAVDLFLRTDGGTTGAAGARARPGSYQLPELRRAVEELCRRGDVAFHLLWNLVERAMKGPSRWGWVELPSKRTVRRWRQERRWELPGWRGPSRPLPKGV